MKKKKRVLTPSREFGDRSPSSVPDLPVLFPEYRQPAFLHQVNERAVEDMKELREAYMHVGLALYVGAGVSRSIGLPSWPELIRALTLTMMTRKVESAFATLGKLKGEKYWQEIAKIQEEVEKTADYDKPMLMMARAIKHELKDELPFAIVRTFRRHLWRARNEKHHDKTMSYKFRDGLPDSPLLNALICLARSERDTKGVQAIVNYNYDDSLDKALKNGNVRCVTVKSGKDHVPQGALPCYHVHGVLPTPLGFWVPSRKRRNEGYGNFVFSEDEYHAEYSDPYRWSNMTQISLLGRYTGLFVGLSLEDPNIRRLIDVTHRQYPESHNYAVLPRKHPLAGSKDTKEAVLRNLFEQVETSSFEKIGVRVIWVDSFEEIPYILQEICNGEKKDHAELHP